MMKRQPYCAALGALPLCATAVVQGPSSANYDESKAGTFTLPDPLTFNNGKPVRTARDWMKRRRPEILQLFETNVYGHSPKPPKHTSLDVFDVDRSTLGNKASRKQVTIYFSPKKDGPREDLLIIPAGVQRPVPVILTLNFFGNQSVINDSGIRLATVWDPRTHNRHQAPEQSRGRDTEFNLEKILAVGYGFATVCYQDIEPDFKGGYKYGIRPLFFRSGQTEPAPGDWGAIGAWSYGLSRAMDYLEKNPDVDARRVAVMGHSRLGKTALWAGALDTRFAMVLSSCSGREAPRWGAATMVKRSIAWRARFPSGFAATSLTTPIRSIGSR